MTRSLRVSSDHFSAQTGLAADAGPPSTRPGSTPPLDARRTMQ